MYEQLQIETTFFILYFRYVGPSAKLVPGFVNDEKALSLLGAVLAVSGSVALTQIFVWREYRLRGKYLDVIRRELKAVSDHAQEHTV